MMAETVSLTTRMGLLKKTKVYIKNLISKIDNILEYEIMPQKILDLVTFKMNLQNLLDGGVRISDIANVEKGLVLLNSRYNGSFQKKLGP